MIYAMKYIRGLHKYFQLKRYDKEAIAPYEDEIKAIITKRQLDSSADWKAFGEKLSGKEIPDFDLEKYKDEYKNAADEAAKDMSFLGQFFIAAMAQKSMITTKIFRSGNLIAGYSIEYNGDASIGIKDYAALIRNRKSGDVIGPWIGEDDGY